MKLQPGISTQTRLPIGLARTDSKLNIQETRGFLALPFLRLSSHYATTNDLYLQGSGGID